MAPSNEDELVEENSATEHQDCNIVLPSTESRGDPLANVEPQWLPRQQTLVVRVQEAHEEPVASTSDRIFIGKLALSSEQLPYCAKHPMDDTFYLHDLEDGFVKVYVRIKNCSPWKGMNMYYLAKCAAFLPSTEAGRVFFSSKLKQYTTGGLDFTVDRNVAGFVLNVFVLRTVVYPSVEVATSREFLRDRVMKNISASLNPILPFIVKDLHLNTNTPSYSENYLPREDFDAFFEDLKTRRQKPTQYRLRTDALTTTLRPYQKDAVRFMMERELQPSIRTPDHFKSVSIQSDLFYYPSCGLFTREGGFQLADVKGGILAEEMGLGKTVELLALISSLTIEDEHVEQVKKGEEDGLSPVRDVADYLVSTVTATVDGEDVVENLARVRNSRRRDLAMFAYNEKEKRQTRGEQLMCMDCGERCNSKKVHWPSDMAYDEFKCPTCMKDETVRAGTTLIVVPQSIYIQWYEEIKRHVRAEVKIDLYQGVQSEGYKHPYYLADMDIVIVSYETLKKELVLVEYQPREGLRKRDYGVRKMAPSPLLSIFWWRICLDESQLVEGGPKQVSSMCAMLRARARWCVTGTPLQRSVYDLSGLFHFLQVSPYSIDEVWQKLLWAPYTNDHRNPLLDLVAQIFWRNSKQDVRDQLGLPPRVNETVQLTFSPLEERMYQNEIESARNRIIDALSSRNFPDDMLLKNLSPRLFDAVWSLMSNIRFSIIAGMSVRDGTQDELLGGGGGGGRGGRKTKKNVYSPEKLFKMLHRATRTQLVDAQRGLLANRNALAGLYWMYGDHEAAFNWYKKGWELVVATKIINARLNLGNWEDMFNEARACGSEGSEDGEDDVDNVTIRAQPVTIDTTQVIHIVRNIQQLKDFLPEVSVFEEANNLEYYAKKAEARFCRQTYAQLQTTRVNYNEKWDEGVVDKMLESRRWVLNGVRQILKMPTLDAQLHGFLRQLPSLPELRDDRANPLSGEPLVEAITVYVDYLRDLFDQINNRAVYLMQEALKQFEDAHPVSQVILDVMHCAHYAESKMSRDDIEKRKKESKEKKEKPEWMLTEEMDTESLMSSRCDLCKLQRNARDFRVKLTGNKNGSLETGVYNIESALNNVQRLSSRVPTADEEMLTAIREGHCNTTKWFLLLRSVVPACLDMVDAVQELAYRNLEVTTCATRCHVGMEVFVPRVMGTNMDQRVQVGEIREEGLLRAFEYADQDMQKEHTRQHALLCYLHDVASESSSSTRQCPICFVDLEKEWMVFPCAHSVCRECYGRLIKTTVTGLRQSQMRCPCCRTVTAKDTVSLVATRLRNQPSFPPRANNVNNPRDLLPVPTPSHSHSPFIPEGVELSVKTEAIVKKIGGLLMEDTGTKILVFTSLTTVLNSMKHVFHSCNLPFVLLQGTSTQRDKNLNKFKFDPTVRICLMPLSSGANGLNLTQANHVIFIEPIIETSVEAQAIGRIDRFGQTRPITVHHFVMKHSVEEEIFRISMSANNSEGWTLGTFKEVFGMGTLNPEVPLVQDQLVDME